MLMFNIDRLRALGIPGINHNQSYIDSPTPPLLYAQGFVWEVTYGTIIINWGEFQSNI